MYLSKKKRSLKKRSFSRVISLILTLCMVLSMFPLSVFASDGTSAEENAWKRMLEIGIVDENGELIEDTAFVLADGREAYSIEEFLEMIDEEDTDPDMTVTVWGNGATATIQELVYALSIEYEMQDITTSLRYLSENDTNNADDAAETNDTADTNSIPRLVVSTTVGDTYFYVNFDLQDEDGNSIEADEDVTFDVGMFGDIDDWFEEDLSVGRNTGITFGDTVGINKYVSRTIEKGESSVDIYYQTTRLETDIENIYGTSGNPLSSRPDFWAGYLPFIVQIKNLRGAVIENDDIWTDAASVKLSYERKDTVDNYFYTDGADGTTAIDSTALAAINKISDTTYTKAFVYDFSIDDLKLTDAEKTNLRLLYENGVCDVITVNLTFTGSADYNKSDIISESNTSLYVKLSDGNWYAADVVTRAYSEFNSDTSRGFQYTQYKTVFGFKLPYTAVYEEPYGSETYANTEVKINTTVEEIAFVVVENTVNEEGVYNAQYLSISDASTGIKKYPSNYTAPTVESVSVVGNQTEFYVGQYVPILVKFSQPVTTGADGSTARVELVLSDGTTLTEVDTDSEGCTVIHDGTAGKTTSSSRLFLYEVKAVDNTAITVNGINAGKGVTDSFGSNKVENITFDEPITLSAHLNTTLPEHSINSVEVTAGSFDDHNGKEYITYTVSASTEQTNTAYKQMWSQYDPETSNFSVAAVFDGDYSSSAAIKPVVMTIEGDDGVLTGSVELPKVYDDSEDTDLTHSVQLYILRNNEYIPVNAYTSFTESKIVKAPEDAYTLTVEKNPLYITDAAAYYLTATKNTSKSWTYDGDDDIELVLDRNDVISLNYNETTKKYAMITLNAGEVNIHVMAKNGSESDSNHYTCSNVITVTVLAGSTPTILFPSNANTYLTRAGDDCTLMFASNLKSMDGDGDYKNKSIEVKLTEKSSGTAVWSTTIDRYSTSVTVPGEYLTEVSSDGEATYTLELKTTGSDGDISTTGYIIVLPQPASVTLDIDGTTFISGKSITIGWSVEQLTDGTTELWIEKDGTVLEKKEYTGAPADGTYTGEMSYTFSATDSLKENYLVIARARNNGDDAWSTDSRIITIYKNGALDIEIDGEKVDSYTLKNVVDSTTTTTSPTITNTSGETISGLDNAAKIAALRSELGLLESISINKSDFAWGSRSDLIKWTADADIDELRQVLTLNYRQGSVYEPLSNFSYLAYIPDAVLMLCGLNEGTAEVTAQHNSVEELSDTVEVSVEKLKDKLYLFSFTPAVETKLTYTDGKGNIQNVKTNSDGSLALYEPNGIASEINCYSESEGEKYLGTISKESLKSGEGNGTKGELYPMNSVSLRKAAVAEIVLTKPDGTPYVGDVTLRGGVYRNLPYAENRDDAYCENAKFAKESDEPAVLNGREDMTFTTDSNGKLTIYMDITQFTTETDPDPIELHEDIQYIFELRTEGYYPNLVTIDSNLTVKDVMRKGENRVSLKEADTAEIFVASQTVDYGTGREIQITDSTSRIGPNATYQTAELESVIMLWGVNTAGCDYDVTLRQQNEHTVFKSQTVIGTEEATYPFSSINLIKNVTVFDESSFDDFSDSTIKAEYKIYDKNQKGIGCIISLRPKVVDLTNEEKIQESDNLLNLMARISLFSSVNGAESSGSLLKKGADKVIDSALEFATKMGSEAGLVKCVLTPTEDPARFTGYFWTGMNTLKMDDLEYDANGVSIEPNFLDAQLNDTFSISDFKSMADGSYFEDRSSLWGAVANGVIGSPVSLALEGWFSTDIRYNLDKGEWEVLMTGGGFTAGAELQFEQAKDILVGPGIPLTFSVKLRGGVVVDFKTAIRYSQELGEGWDDDKASTVNDYLTALRINAYIELFGGLGWGKKITCKIGAFGTLEIDNENRFLTKNYLKSESLKGQYLSLNGEVGIKVALGIGPIELEITIASVGLGQGWTFNDWDDIDEYWYGSDDGEDGTNAMSLSMAVSSDPGYVVLDNTVQLQSREYLTNDREENFAEMSYDALYAADGLNGVLNGVLNNSEENKLNTLVVNAYPYSSPMITDDAQIMVFLSDMSSTNIEDVTPVYAIKVGDSYSEPQVIEDDETSSFPGYGDYTLDVDGTAETASAVWLRQSASLGLKAGTEVTAEQQYALLNGSEVMAAIWDGESWQTTRLTENSFREDSPVTAASENGAIVLWQQIQTGDEIGETVNDAVLYKIYNDGKWGDTYTLYSGDAGEVLDLDVKMLDNGTAAAAYSVSATNSSDDSEVYYSLIDTTAADPTESVKTVRVSENNTEDDKPSITKTELDGKDVFVLAWHKLSDESGVELHDIGFLVFDENGTPESNIPDSLSASVSVSNFDGLFDLTDGAEDITELSVVWNDKKAGDSENDIMRAVRLGLYDNVYAFSAAFEAAVMPDNTGIENISSSAADGKITAVMSAEELLNTKTTKSYEFIDEDGETVKYTLDVPDSRSLLCNSVSYYSDDIEVSDIMVDFSTLNTNTPTPISFTITNKGINVLTSVNIEVDGTASEFECRLMPGEYKTFCTIYTTGDEIKDAAYNCTAEFDSGTTAETEGEVYLDYPDVGISGITLTKQSDRVREISIGLYNQSASTLTKQGRYVRFGIYSDSECEEPIDGKYFADGTAGEGYTIDITSEEDLAAIDEGILSVGAEFEIGDYVNDLGMTEIPSGGINLFVKAEIVEDDVVLPESDTLNNNARKCFESLLDIRGETISTDNYMRQGADGTSVDVVLSNNSLEPVSGGNIIAALYNENGELLETKRTYGSETLEMTGEEIKSFTFDFSQTGSYVLVWFTDDVSEAEDDSDVIGIYLEGTDLTIDSFDENNYAELNDIAMGNYILTVLTANPNAKVYVDGIEAINGMTTLRVKTTREYTITIVSPDGSSTIEYKLMINVDYPDIDAENDDDEMSVYPGMLSYCTLTFDTNGGDNIMPLRRLFKTVINLSSYVPEREGYEFLGWYSDAALTNRVTKVQLTRNMTVYAGWEKIDDIEEYDGIADENTLPFTDVYDTDWFVDDVYYVYENGLMRGTSEDTFSPYLSATRAMIVTVLYRMEGEPECGDNTFVDIPEDMYYTDAVTWAAENGIVNGYGQGRFGPDDNITREQLAAILYRYSLYKGYDVTADDDSEDILDFDDISELSDYAYTAMQWACSAGLINGMGDGTLQPKNNASRCQIAAVLHRFCEIYVD